MTDDETYDDDEPLDERELAAAIEALREVRSSGWRATQERRNRRSGGSKG